MQPPPHSTPSTQDHSISSSSGTGAAVDGEGLDSGVLLFPHLADGAEQQLRQDHFSSGLSMSASCVSASHQPGLARQRERNVGRERRTEGPTEETVHVFSDLLVLVQLAQELAGLGVVADLGEPECDGCCGS
jgi:hypothetical protein